MKIAIVGSRDYPDEQQVRDYVGSLPKGTTVISGGARGVDTWAVDEALLCGLTTDVFLAEWTRWGKSAGMRRNTLMVHEADKVVAFHYRNSPGTAHSIKLAKQFGKLLKVFTPREAVDAPEQLVLL